MPFYRTYVYVCIYIGVCLVYVTDQLYILIEEYKEMDTNTSGYFLNHETLQSVYYQAKEEHSLIDLGLSLRTLQPQAYHPSEQVEFGVRADDYADLIEWHKLNPQQRNYERSVRLDCEDETEGVQSKERWAFVKVNMDGVIVGRKICIDDHIGYSSLALQLEDMFGRQSTSGLRLFQAGSEFTLFYKDKDDNWRTVGDVPWRQFVDCVKRLRIVQKNEALVPTSPAFP